MSVHQGKKIATAVNAFNAEYAANDEYVIAKLANTLKTRQFGQKHFDQADIFLRKMRDAMPVKIIDQYDYRSSLPISKKSLDFFAVYMGIDRGENEELNYDNFSPSLINFKMRQGLLNFNNRLLPIKFSSQHTEYRFIQRTANPLEYNSDDFIYTMMTGLALSMVMPTKITNDGYVPVTLPDGNGMYLGYAQLHHIEDFYPIEWALALNDGVTPASVIGVTEALEPAWGPRSRINIQTYISKNQFSSKQSALYDRFAEVLRAQKTQQSFTALLNTYGHGLSLNKTDNKMVSLLLDEFHQIVQSSEWDNANFKGDKHLPKIDLN